jgi:transcriptional regulator GlxA family with amidase domain
MTRMPVFYQRQAGKQTKQSVLLDLNAESDRIQVALAYAQKHLATQLGVEELAAAVLSRSTIVDGIAVALFDGLPTSASRCL